MQRDNGTEEPKFKRDWDSGKQTPARLIFNGRLVDPSNDRGSDNVLTRRYLMLEWIQQNQVFSGVAGVLLTAALGFFVKRRSSKVSDTGTTPPVPPITINNTNTQGTGATIQPDGKQRRDKRILFVDDDTKFKVVKIMRASGWTNVSIKKDIRDLGARDVIDTDVFFIDIQGVGQALGFTDGGLGLSLAIKQKYPEKKVVIYSAQTDGDRFHKALNRADGSLAKNADPYEFIALLDELADK